MFTVETYFLCCKESGLSMEDLEAITVGDALDYQEEYVKLHSTDESNGQTVNATQQDFDSF
ncbi:hypothetical protein [Streptococcus uberis]|uniref:hypothetical protein n=1 Tax=Streptococcus uberis TaxID=1349 RepID=UPI0019399978|nr:hypothetical protein [Streptococcus uberis]